MRLALLSLAVLLGSCGAPQAASGPPATASGDGADLHPVAKPGRDELAEKTLERVPGIQDELAALRELPFKRPVSAERQTNEEFREFLDREIARELPPEPSARRSRALHHIGLLEERLDLADTLREALAAQVAGYYDPRDDKFFLVQVTEDARDMDAIIAHELAHALQDQHFDLLAYYGEEPKQELTEDQLNARRFVVEGEATLLMVAYTIKAVTGKDPFSGTNARLLRAQIGAIAGMSVEQLIEMSRLQAQVFVDADEETRRAIEELDKVPRYILTPLLESYTKGALPIMEVFVAGGWEAIGELYTNPPDSTEQVLHPREKLVGERDRPVEIELPALRPLAGWSELHADVKGELLWRVYFGLWRPEDWEPERIVSAAAGWGGDRYAVYAEGDATAALLATAWDDEEEAVEFEAAYLATLGVRFAGGEARRKGSGKAAVTIHPRPDGSEIAVARRGAAVFIVDGAPAGSAAAWVAELARSAAIRPPK